MNETPLTNEAREAIRAYMLRLVTIPGIVATLGAAAIGFLINDIATQGAHNEAYKDASSVILGFTGEISRAAAEVKQAKLRADEVVVDVEDIKARLETTEKLHQADDVVASVAENIADRDDFKQTIADAIQDPTYDSGWFDLGQNCRTIVRDVGFEGLPRSLTAYYKIYEGNVESIFPWGLNQYGDSHQTNGVLIDFDENGTVYMRLPCGSKKGNNVLHLGNYRDRRDVNNSAVVSRKDVQFRILLWK